MQQGMKDRGVIKEVLRLLSTTGAITYRLRSCGNEEFPPPAAFQAKCAAADGKHAAPDRRPEQGLGHARPAADHSSEKA
jgi:hypothetical protein